MLHKLAANVKRNLRMVLTPFAIIMTTVAANAVIAYCAITYICNQIESANRSAEYTTRTEIEKAVEQITEKADRNHAGIMSFHARQSLEKPDLSGMAEELKAIRAEMDSIRSSINAIDTYSLSVHLNLISKQLNDIQDQTQHITTDPTLVLPRFNKTLDEKLDSIQMGIDAIDKSIFTLSLRISQL